MGTTLEAVAFIDNQAIYARIGDSHRFDSWRRIPPVDE